MAVTATPNNVQLQLTYFAEVVNGVQKYTNKNYGRVKSSATIDDVYAVGQAIAGLSSKTLYKIDRMVDSTLVNA